MTISAKSDIGKVRDTNQDAFASGDLPDGALWAVVCDGMGGARGGNEASRLAVKTITEQLRAGYRTGMRSQSLERLLLSAVNAANVIIYDTAQQFKEYAGMGTTVVCAIVADGCAQIAYVGDSRVYLLNETVTRLTHDHSVVQDMIDKGEITEDEAKVHPKKHIITRAVGVKPEVHVDFCEQPIAPNDILLLCSDGLTNFVEEADILQTAKTEQAEQLADCLVQKALENGGGDNVTVVTIRQ